MRPGGPCPAPELSLEPSGHFLGVREQRAGPRPSKAMHLGDTRTHCPHSGFRPADTSRVAGGQAPRVCSDFSCRGAVGQTAEEASPRGAQTRPPPPEAGLCVGRAQAGLGRAAARPAHSPRPPGAPGTAVLGDAVKNVWPPGAQWGAQWGAQACNSQPPSRACTPPRHNPGPFGAAAPPECDTRTVLPSLGQRDVQCRSSDKMQCVCVCV